MLGFSAEGFDQDLSLRSSVGFTCGCTGLNCVGHRSFGVLWLKALRLFALGLRGLGLGGFGEFDGWAWGF